MNKSGSSAQSVDSLGSESSADTNVDYNCGELKMLSSQAFDFLAEGASVTDETIATEDSAKSVKSEAVYGSPLDDDHAQAAVPEGDGGLCYHALLIPDDFISNGTLMAGLNKRDYNIKTTEIKDRRASLPVTQTQLFSSLTKVEGTQGPRYIFNGVLNGWPGLKFFELIKIEKRRELGPLTAPEYFTNAAWASYWSADKEGADGVSPAIKDRSKLYRATLRTAPWARKGWSADSPGYVFWYEAQNTVPKLSHGTRMLKVIDDTTCTNVHMISHRYFVPNETAKDKLTYHTLVLLEWEHGKYTTIVEGAWLNGVGGYKGKCNWYDDKNEPTTALYRALPSEMIQPWNSSASEIRVYDVAARNLDEFKEYIEKYNGSRFSDPHYTFSHPARLSFCSKANIAQYLLNYIGRDGNYSEITRNCQTLAADLCSFLAGKKGVVPFHPINRFEYHNRSHLFLYESDMFSDKKKKRSEILKSKLLG